MELLAKSLSKMTALPILNQIHAIHCRSHPLMIHTPHSGCLGFDCQLKAVADSDKGCSRNPNRVRNRSQQAVTILLILCVCIACFGSID